MTFIDRVKKRIGNLTETARDELAAHDEKAESDVASDSHVAGSRAGDDGSDGKYVGRTGPDIDSDVEQSGAEARSEENRLGRGVPSKVLRTSVSSGEGSRPPLPSQSNRSRRTLR